MSLSHTSSQLSSALITYISSSSANTTSIYWILLAIASGGLCVGGVTVFYLSRRRKPKTHLPSSFDLEAVMIPGRKVIGRKYYQLSTIVQEEAREIYLQTGHLISFPSGQKKMKYLIGRGEFGSIKVAQRIEDEQYVVSKKVRGEENIRLSAAEAELQKAAAGENILPIFNTIRFDDALYHFMPLAGFGDGEAVQRRFFTLTSGKLKRQILRGLEVSEKGRR